MNHVRLVSEMATHLTHYRNYKKEKGDCQMALTKSQLTPRFKIEHIVLGIVILLLIIGALFDKPISQTFMDQNSYFGTLLQNYSLVFPAIIIFMSAQVLFYRIQRSNVEAIGKFAVMFLAIVASIYEIWQAVKIALIYTISSLNNIKNKAPLGAANNDNGKHAALPSWYMPALVILTIIFLAIGLALCYKWLVTKDESEMQRLTYVALAAILAVFAADTIVNTMKDFWGRFRPYEINSEWSNFTSWLHVNGQNGHKSFPSGHSQ